MRSQKMPPKEKPPSVCLSTTAALVSRCSSINICDSNGTMRAYGGGSGSASGITLPRKFVLRAMCDDKTVEMIVPFDPITLFGPVLPDFKTPVSVKPEVAIVALSGIRQCWNCAKTLAKIKSCPNCRQAIYCDRTCQK